MVYGLIHIHASIKHILQLVAVAARRDSSGAADIDRISAVPSQAVAAVSTVRSFPGLDLDIQVVAQRMAANASGDFGHGGIGTSNKRGWRTG
jgi:hypothetical protein